MLSILSWWPMLRKHSTGTGGRGAGKVIGTIKAWVDDPLVVLKIVAWGDAAIFAQTRDRIARVQDTGWGAAVDVSQLFSQLLRDDRHGWPCSWEAVEDRERLRRAACLCLEALELADHVEARRVMLNGLETVHYLFGRYGFRVPEPLRLNTMCDFLARRHHRTDDVRLLMGGLLSAGEPVPEEWFTRLADDTL